MSCGGPLFPHAANASPHPLKPFTSVPQQLDMLRRLGLGIEDAQRAGQLLKRIGYFRFSGYAHSLKTARVTDNEQDERFHPDATFDIVEGLAEFDKSLRLLVLHGLGTNEIAMRACVVARLGGVDIEAHRQPHLVDRRFTTALSSAQPSLHEEWLRRFDDLCAKSKEDFVEHHRRRYGGKLPVWAAMEVLDFGLLSKLVGGLQQRDGRALARQLNLEHAGVLKSWMHMFNVLRNRAAHHARLWNRTTPKIPLLPSKNAAPDLFFLHDDDHARTRLFGTLSCMRAMIRIIAPEDDWHREVKGLMGRFPQFLGLSMRSAGFPADWQRLGLWAD